MDAVLGQELGHVVGTKLGPGEDQHLAPVVLLDDVRQQRFFLAAAHWVDQLRDALHRGVARRDLDALRIFKQSGGEFADLAAEGGRKQKALFVFGHHGQHFLDVVDKAHIKHAVCLVEHQNLHLAQIEHALLQQVEQAPGRGHQDVDAFFHTRDLRVHADAAKHHGR